MFVLTRYNEIETLNRACSSLYLFSNLKNHLSVLINERWRKNNLGNFSFNIFLQWSKYDTNWHFKKNVSLFLPENYLDFLLTLIVFIICPLFLIFTVFCFGSISLILNGLIVLRRKSLLVAASCKCLTVALVPAIFSVSFLWQS